MSFFDVAIIVDYLKSILKFDYFISKKRRVNCCKTCYHKYLGRYFHRAWDDMESDYLYDQLKLYAKETNGYSEAEQIDFARHGLEEIVFYERELKKQVFEQILNDFNGRVACV